MKPMIKFAAWALLLFAACPLRAQFSPPAPVRYVTVDPTGVACSGNAKIDLRTPGGTLYTCQSGVYAAVGGSGSVTLAGDVTGASGANTVVKINNVPLSGLATGPLCNTTTSGAPYACPTGIANVKDYGALGDERFVSDAGITASASTITSASAAFTAADTGKTVTIFAGAQGLQTVTYTSGGSITGAAGSYCTVTTFNGSGSGAAGIVKVTGTNTIAASSPIRITATGTGYSAATTAVLASGYGATCSGAIVVSTTALYPHAVTGTATYVNATTITLSTTATTTVTNAVMSIGTDDSAAVIAAIAATSTAGGGTIYFPPGAYLVLSQLAIPNDGATVPSQKSMTFLGDGAKQDGTWSCLGFANCSANAAASILDLRYAGTVAKIDTRGKGQLAFTNLSLEDRGDDTLAFVQTTLTSVVTTLTSVVGSGLGGTASQQDAFVLGGTATAGSPTGLSTSPFYGFGTWIKGVFFDKIIHGVWGRIYTNSITISNNVWSATCGGAEAILIDGTGAEATNNVWFGNLIQQNGYQYTATMLNAANNYGYANTGWDGNVVGPDSWRFTGTAGVSTGNICLGCMNMAALDSATGNVWLLLSANVFSGALSSDTVTSTVGNVVAKQNIVIGTGSQIVGNGNIGAKLYAPDASTWVMWNNNQNDFGLLKFGGTTSSFPALKRSTTGLLVRLADDSADAPISTSALNNTGASFTFNGHTCTIVSTVITCP